MPAPESRAVRHVVPEHEMRCVWMTAGILSYRICSRNHDCASCLLDQALSQRCLQEAGNGLEPLPPQHFLHRGHAWLHVSEGGEAVVGLDDFARRLLGPATWIELPEEGHRVARGERLFRVSHGPVESDVRAPAAGRVVAVNEALRENPGRLNRSPYDAGWVLRMVPERFALDVPHLLFGRTVDAWLCEELRVLEREVAGALGLTLDDDSVRLNDGGKLSADFLNGLPLETRARIVHRFLMRPEADASSPAEGGNS